MSFPTLLTLNFTYWVDFLKSAYFSGQVVMFSHIRWQWNSPLGPILTGRDSLLSIRCAFLSSWQYSVITSWDSSHKQSERLFGVIQSSIRSVTLAAGSFNYLSWCVTKANPLHGTWTPSNNVILVIGSWLVVLASPLCWQFIMHYQLSFRFPVTVVSAITCWDFFM